MIKKWQNWTANLSVDETQWLTAVFAAAMLGTIASTTVLRLGLAAFGDDKVLMRLGVCLLATAAYAGAVVAVFWVLYPDARLVLKQATSKIFNK